MNRPRSAHLLIILSVLGGCANMSAPDPINWTPCEHEHKSSLCLLNRVQREYDIYLAGASKNQRVANGIMLASAATGAIGASVGSGSELYKSAGAIGLSALGYSNYGNFNLQQKVVGDANKRLTNAKTKLTKLLNAAEAAEIKTYFADNQSFKDLQIGRAHV